MNEHEESIQRTTLKRDISQNEFFGDLSLGIGSLIGILQMLTEHVSLNPRGNEQGFTALAIALGLFIFFHELAEAQGKNLATLEENSKQ